MEVHTTLVMRGDYFVEGAIALGKSIRNSGDKRPMICMVTSDVSPEGRNRLNELWQLNDVAYWSNSTPLPELASPRINALYKDWINVSFTKWRFLDFFRQQSDLKTILYHDADSIVMQQIDDIFDDLNSLPSTSKLKIAANCKSYFACVQRHDKWRTSDLHEITCRMDTKNSSLSSNSVCIDLAAAKSHAMLQRTLMNASEDNHKRHYLFNSAFLLVSRVNVNDELSLESIDDLIETIDIFLKSDRLAKENTRFYNGWDEQVFFRALAQQSSKNVHFVPLRSVCSWPVGFYSEINNMEQPRTAYWWGDKKPWDCRETTSRYNDIYLWRYFYNL